MKFKKNKKYYWDKVYSRIKNVEKPSTFAKFCLKRFIDGLKKKRYKIIYQIEKRGMSKFKNDNPVLCRVIFGKLSNTIIDGKTS